MQHLLTQFQQLLSSSTPEEIELLSELLEKLRQKQQGHFSTSLSAVLGLKKELHEDSCSVSVPNNGWIHNSSGIPHGGILATLADTAMGILATSKCPEGFSAVTVNFNIHYLSVADGTEIIADATIVRQGRHLITSECGIRQPDGREIAIATGSFMAVPKQS
ncbi:PaaI family thioesterase [Indiicoccus explosivorum]|uniref:PaaI family thioesterase n=1 Tax=Indiicoccus explosivorum TaxID=1917864 RepID=UPI000B448F0E|nr:PaaI family thioesterase [Indiicoccus explosivorum]